jgi:hypothetical protein
MTRLRLSDGAVWCLVGYCSGFSCTYRRRRAVSISPHQVFDTKRDLIRQFPIPAQHIWLAGSWPLGWALGLFGVSINEQENTRPGRMSMSRSVPRSARRLQSGAGPDANLLLISCPPVGFRRFEHPNSQSKRPGPANEIPWELSSRSYSCLSATRGSTSVAR